MRPKVVISWSSGKDSAYAMHELLVSKEFEVAGILTTVSKEYKRISMHGVRESLLELQATALGCPIFKVYIPTPCSNEIYEQEMSLVLELMRDQGVSYIAFGDLFLEDLRSYREQKLANTGIKPLFPLWKRNTHSLAKEMLSSGIRAKITCIDPRKLDRSFSGREYNESFLAELPESVDPCGENGEFHSFVYAGPMFKEPISVSVGEIVDRDGFVFADVLPC